MNAKHTPGDWKYGATSREIYSTDQGQHIATVHVAKAGAVGPYETEANANGRLLALAPELWAALSTLTVEVEMLEMMGETGATASRANVDAALSAARSVIAKAKGQA